jgi:mRNA interferase YafQ
MRTIEATGRFKREYARRIRGTELADELDALLGALAGFQELPARYRDHPLHGEWQGCRDFHLWPDLVVIYRRTQTRIVLYRVGSHAELFGR